MIRIEHDTTHLQGPTEYFVTLKEVLVWLENAFQPHTTLDTPEPMVWDCNLTKASYSFSEIVFASPAGLWERATRWADSGGLLNRLVGALGFEITRMYPLLESERIPLLLWNIYHYHGIEAVKTILLRAIKREEERPVLTKVFLPPTESMSEMLFSEEGG
jgi:hypothetical protein